MSTQRLLTIDEVAEILNLKKSTLYSWIHYKKIPYVKPGGGRVRFREDEINEFIQKSSFKPG